MSGAALLGASCPSGGTFYICENKNVEFIGCCMINPCETTSGNCPQDKLREASFSRDHHDEIPAQACDKKVSGALWYTCSQNLPPFMGCCRGVNPCSRGSCPVNNLAPARLSSNETNRRAFLGDPSTSTSTISTSSQTQSATATLTDGASSSPDPEAKSSGALGTGAIVGIAVGAVALLAVAIAFFIIRRRRNARKKWASEGGMTFASSGPPAGPTTSFKIPPKAPQFSAFTPLGQTEPETEAPEEGMGLAVIQQRYGDANDDRVVSQISQVSQVSEALSPTYRAYQPSVLGASPDLAELPTDDSPAFGNRARYSDLPAGDVTFGGTTRQKEGYRELQG
ncbi:hypothetical protein QBC35DRAFT_447642 [Podospora australis]|uniref:Uncharacterized protein n=1 Tax=Podospora australis TaxID=1536484 RepID=A0AAN6X1W7_9PEZI|nr:hypothetical protein QBC35DRAFT_447642 [Podospora australis]